MYTLTNLTTGVNYKSDVVKAFQDALAREENLEQGYGSTNFWNFVSADMHIELSTWYAASYIDEAFEYMVDLEDEDRQAEIHALQFA